MLARTAARMLALTTLVAGAMVAPELLASEQPDWRIVVASNAFISHGVSTRFEAAITDGRVAIGDRLTTRKGGALVLSRGADVIALAENTQISIVDPQPARSTLIEQPYGQAQYKIEHKAQPHFEVDTPLLATVVKGTTFTVRAGATFGAVSVQNGKVQAVDRRDNARSFVSTGQTGTVANASRTVTVSATPAASAAAPSPGPVGPAAPGSAPAGPAGGPSGPAGGPANHGSKAGGPAGGGPGGGPGGGSGGGSGGGGPGGGGPGGGDGPGGGPGGGGPGGGKGASGGGPGGGKGSGGGPGNHK